MLYVSYISVKLEKNLNIFIEISFIRHLGEFPVAAGIVKRAVV